MGRALPRRRTSIGPEMTARISKIEKLARDICWAEWVGDYRPECGKAAYWNGLHPDVKTGYIVDAKWFQFICRKLKPLRILQMVDIDYPRQTRGKKA